MNCLVPENLCTFFDVNFSYTEFWSLRMQGVISNLPEVFKDFFVCYKMKYILEKFWCAAL